MPGGVIGVEPAGLWNGMGCNAEHDLTVSDEVILPNSKNATPSRCCALCRSARFRPQVRYCGRGNVIDAGGRSYTANQDLMQVGSMVNCAANGAMTCDDESLCRRPAPEFGNNRRRQPVWRGNTLFTNSTAACGSATSIINSLYRSSLSSITTVLPGLWTSQNTRLPCW
jgi:hypothetical protein